MQVPDPDPGAPGYVQLGLRGIPAIGLRPADAATPEWMTYFAVDDVDAAATRVDADGGRIVREARTSAVGTMATFADPEGATFSVIA